MSKAGQKNIVILGGGYAGLESLLALSKKDLNGACIILISKANFLYHNVATPRALVENKLSSDICIPFDNLVDGINKKFIHGIFNIK